MIETLTNFVQKLYVTDVDETTGKKSVRLNAVGSTSIIHILFVIFALYVSVGRNNGFSLGNVLFILFFPVLGPVIYLFLAVLDTMKKYPGGLTDAVTFNNLVTFKETASSEEFLKHTMSMLSNLTALDTL